MKKCIATVVILMCIPIVALGGEPIGQTDEVIPEKMAKEFATELTDEINNFIDEVDPPDDGKVSTLNEEEIPEKISTMDDFVNQPDESKISQHEAKTLLPKANKINAPKALPLRLKSGFHRTVRACPVRTQPKNTAPTDGQVSQGLRIWVDVVDATWVKIYRKKGHGYVGADCLKNKVKSAVSAL